MKLNVLLAKTDALASSFKATLKDYISFFKTKQGAFQGLQKTYDPNPGTIDDPKLRGYTRVASTVNEKLAWFEETNADYIDALFAQERTNAEGHTVLLEVGDVNFGAVTALELLRLKSILESQDLKSMYENIPVRSDSKIWKKTENEDYKDRDIYETDRLEGINKTTEKEQYILSDPNAGAGNRAPQVASKTTVVELGKYTSQEFSGEMSHRERAEILRRRQMLHTAVIEALKEVNDVEAMKSDITAEKLFGYLHKGI